VDLNSFYFPYTRVIGVTYTAVDVAATTAKKISTGGCPAAFTLIYSVVPGAIQLLPVLVAVTGITAVGAVAPVLKNTGSVALVFTTFKNDGPLAPSKPTLAAAGVMLLPLDEAVAVRATVAPATMYADIIVGSL
jgi:hypothetical protein